MTPVPVAATVRSPAAVNSERCPLTVLSPFTVTESASLITRLPLAVLVAVSESTAVRRRIPPAAVAINSPVVSTAVPGVVMLP